MQQLLIGIIIVLGLGGYFLYNQNTTLKQNNAKLEIAIVQQEEAIAVIRESYEKQGASLNQMMSKNAQIEQEMNGYLDIFRRHNLNKLAIAKPGMIETRANSATKDVFESIENDSKELDSLDNPSADINPNN